MDSVFGAQVGDWTFWQLTFVFSGPPGVLIRQVLVESAGGLGVEIMESLRLVQGAPSIGVERPEHVDRVVVLIPQGRIDGSPEIEGDRIPGPPEVVGELIEQRKPGRYAKFV